MRITTIILTASALALFASDEKPKTLTAEDRAAFWKAEQAVSAAVAACEDCTITRIARDRIVKRLREFCAPQALEVGATGDLQCAAPPPPKLPEKK